MQGSTLRGTMLGATALALLLSPVCGPVALAGVGVTTATDGDPLGKPPREAERVLRIGIDVQANEMITTNASDRAHLVFLDGSSLTVGPNAQLTIDRFVFDPVTKTGDLSINASKGVLRLVGGKISKNSAIKIQTPSGTIGIRGGITILEVGANRTDSTFVFGKDMTVTAAGQTQTAMRPGSTISTLLGGPPGLPQIIAKGALNGQLGQLEGRPASGGGPGGGSAAAGGGSRAPDQMAQSSGLSRTNSGQPVRIVAPGMDSFGSGPGPRNRNPNDTIVTAISNTNPAVDPQNQPNAIALAELPPAPITFDNFTRSGAVQPPASPGGSGFQTPVSDVNTMTSTATYSGGMVGIVNNRSIAVGSYQNVWNFATRSGAATMNFDGANFQGTTVANGNSVNFSSQGRIPSTNSNRSIGLNGSFYSAPGNPAGFQVGTFNVNGGGYNANGIFAGKKN